MSNTIMKVVEEEVNEKLVEYLLNYIKYNYNNAPEDGEEFNAPTDEVIREHIHNYIFKFPFVFKDAEITTKTEETEEDEWFDEQQKKYEDSMLKKANKILQEPEPEPQIVKKVKKVKKNNK